MTYRVWKVDNGFVIDNGEEQLARCGCCGLLFNEYGAEETVKKLESGVVDWRMLMLAAEMWAQEDEARKETKR